MRADYFAELAVPGVPGSSPATGDGAKPSRARMSPVSPVSPVKKEREEDGQPQQPVEVIKWLSPCPVCGGLKFIQRRQGGFFCIECQPTPAGKIKRKVRAPGQAPVRAMGYGCGKCGNRVYRQAPAGWLCEGCGMVFNLIGGSRGPVLVH